MSEPGRHEDEALRDPALHRALDHAPDREARPDARTREAILKTAHNLAPLPSAAPAAPARGAYWRRWFGAAADAGEKPRARMPWNAAFATVLVAAFVTVLWHREPVPDARLDGEAQVAKAPAPAAPAAAPAPAPSVAEASPAPEAAAETMRRRADDARPRREAGVAREQPAPERSAQESRSSPALRSAPAAPPAPAPAPMAPPPVLSAPAPAVVAEPAPTLAPQAAPAAPAPAQDAAADRAAAAPSPPPGAQAEASGALRQAPAPRAAAAAKSAAGSGGAPSRPALERWTVLDAVIEGRRASHARGDTEGLAALVSAAARSATAPGGELVAPVDARLALRDDARELAVLELAGDQVRWMPQGSGGPAYAGTPPAQVLAALRAALARR